MLSNPLLILLLMGTQICSVGADITESEEEDPTCATLNFVNTECQVCADDTVGIEGGIITNINEDGTCFPAGTCVSGICTAGK